MRQGRGRETGAWLPAVLLLSALGAQMIRPESAGAGVPDQIHYQGTLRENGVPVNGSRQFRFRITDASGGTIYWDSGPQSVLVTNGLLRLELQPVGVSWESATPYLEVSVEGTTLLPRERIAAAPYSLLAASATFAQTAGFAAAAGDGVPPGMIAMFDGSSCPSGWTEVTSLRDRFPMGWDGLTVAGDSNTGGTSSHRHTAPVGASDGRLRGGDPPFGTNPAVTIRGWDHNITNVSVGAEAMYTTIENHLPPFRRVIFCRKN